MKKSDPRLIVVICFAFLGISIADSGARAQQGSVFRHDTLRIETAQGRHTIRVEVAETQSQRAQGLMWRRHLAPDAGMLFDFETVAPVVMWMKNTYVSLDMLFIDARGRIINIARNTTPHSTQYITSAAPVLAVLELPAGTARRLAIKAGDRVLHSIFQRSTE